jgi:4-hydroxy-4-methyl-2-oxoglutarate aldolase
MELLGLPRSIINGLKMVSDSPLRAIVGPAFTVRQAPKGRASAHEDNLTRQREAAGTLASPGDIIIIDAAGREDISTWGENLTLAARSRGVAGLVVHGAIRDSERIRRTGFPVLCRACTPVASRWDLQTVAMNEPIIVSGVHIRPGDILYGDTDGLIVIPVDSCEEVFSRALDVHRQEEERRASLYG